MLNTTTNIYRAFFSELEKMAEIMPSTGSESVKRVPGSAIPRGPRVRAGGRVGTTTATPFSGNKAKIAGWGHAALGAGALLGGGAVAYRALRRPLYDEFVGDGPPSSSEHYGPAANVRMGVGSPTLRAAKNLLQKRRYAQQSQLAENPYGAGPVAY
jgi:hypothetical protein